MEHFIALYEAKTGKKVAAAQRPLLLEHLHQTFREYLANSETPKGTLMIPARYVLMCIGTWFENWSDLQPLKDLGTRSLNDLPVKISHDFGLQLYRTRNQHNLYEYMLKKDEERVREAMERYKRTVQWVNEVIQIGDLKKSRGPKFPDPDSYVCGTCIYCFPNLE